MEKSCQNVKDGCEDAQNSSKQDPNDTRDESQKQDAVVQLSGLKRQPTKYPHGLDISVQTISEGSYSDNYSRASTLRSTNECNNWKDLQQPSFCQKLKQSFDFSSLQRTETSPNHSTTSSSNVSQQTQSSSYSLTSSNKSVETPSTLANSKKYRISFIRSPENFAELSENCFKYPLSGNYYLDAPNASKKSQFLLMKYAKRFCLWKYMRWPLIFVGSVFLFFGLITYCIWLHDVSIERESHLQKPQQWEDKESSEEILLTSMVRNINNPKETVLAMPTMQPPSPVQEWTAFTEEVFHTSSQSTKLNTIEGNDRRPTSITMKSNLGSSSKQALEKHPRPYFDDDSALEPAHSIRFTSGHQNNFEGPLEDEEFLSKFYHKGLSTDPPNHSVVNMRTKVSPTIPPIHHSKTTQPMPTNKAQVQQESRCYSTALEMCRGVLDYDLTYNSTITMSTAEEVAYKELIASNCSTRAVEFICAALEPECRPKHIGILPPCRRICKAILEACSIEVATSDILTATFDCSLYPDSNDPNKCDDPTRRRGYCYDNEFECYDRSCIPHQWQCDNIKDCAMGEDEEGCLECDQEQEFRCHSNEKCIPETARCDSNYDCFDASDEEDCDDYSLEGSIRSDDPFDHHELNETVRTYFPRIFSYASILLPNQSNENLYSYITAATEDDGSIAKTQLNQITNVTTGTFHEEVTNTFPGDTPNGFVNFRDSKEIMMTSDSENKFKYSRVNRTSSTSIHNATTPNLSQPTDIPKVNETKSLENCAPHELRCISGKCITVKQLCDKNIDCPDGADELMCVYKVRSTTTRSVNGNSNPFTSDKEVVRTALRRKTKS